jgi:hypothetical protein
MRYFNVPQRQVEDSQNLMLEGGYVRSWSRLKVGGASRLAPLWKPYRTHQPIFLGIWLFRRSVHRGRYVLRAKREDVGQAGWAVWFSPLAIDKPSLHLNITFVT